MFEDKTFEKIIEEMMGNVPDNVDKREGSVIYDALAPIAMELAQVYIDMDMILEECFADTASYYYLIKRAAERGIFVKEGKPAVLKVQVEPADIEIEEGTEFSIGEMNYVITENMGEGFYSITCTEEGKAGNNTSDDIVPMEDVAELESITVVSILSAGTEDEEEESLRNRYFESFEESAFGGNRADYKEKINNMDGVEGCKVYRGSKGGVVDIVIIGSNFCKPKDGILQSVQDQIDPNQDGSGDGLAPIGHKVTVSGVMETVVGISADIVYMKGYVWNDVKDTFAKGVDDYFLELSKSWEDMDSINMRAGQIESILLSINGVADVSNIAFHTSDGSESHASLVLERNCIPVRGELNG